MGNNTQQVPGKQWSEMTKTEKNTQIIIGVIVFVVVVIVSVSILGAIAGGNKSAGNTQTSTPVTTEQQVVTPVKSTTPKYVFDVPSLFGKNIDEIRLVLGDPEDKTMTEPTAEQISLGGSEWDNTFKKDGKELLVTFNASTRAIIDFFVSTDDPSGATTDVQHLLDIGNLKDNASNYTIKEIKAVRDPSVITGITIKAN